MKHLLTLAMLLLGSAAQAEIYRCTINGQVVFSDSKCAPNAQRVEILPETVDEQNASSLQRQSQQINQNIGDKLRQPRANDVHDRRIAELEREYEELQQQLTAEQEALKARDKRLTPSERRQLEARLQRIAERYKPRLDEISETLSNLRARQ